MIADILTVMWKEWKEIIRQRGSSKGAVILVFIPALFFGIFFPLQMGREWVESPVTLMIAVWIPLFMVIAVIADSFAGERERHTLETLLASRLSDRAILFGKIGAAISYALAHTALFILLGLVTVNVIFTGTGLLLIPFKLILVGGVIAILMAFLASSAGVLVSLRAKTVRQAHQTLSFSIIILVFLPSILLHVLIKFIPRESLKNLSGGLSTVNPSVVIGSVIVVLFILDAVLLVAAMARFKRTRMILD